MFQHWLFVHEGRLSTLVVCGQRECFNTGCLWMRGEYLHSLFVDERSVSTLVVYG